MVIKCYRSIKFYKNTRIFKKYIEYMFDKRKFCKANNDPMQIVYKLLMNSLYGRFGMRRINIETDVMPKNNVSMLDKFVKNNSLISCVDYGLSLLVEYQAERSIFTEVAPYISSKITSLARVRLMKKVVECHNEGIKVYYCDTDSIVIDRKIKESNELGG